MWIWDKHKPVSKTNIGSSFSGRFGRKRRIKRQINVSASPQSNITPPNSSSPSPDASAIINEQKDGEKVDEKPIDSTIDHKEDGMVFALCLKCKSNEIALQCLNCHRTDNFTLRDNVAKCNCGNKIYNMLCGCGTTIYGKFFFQDKEREAKYKNPTIVAEVIDESALHGNGNTTAIGVSRIPCPFCNEPISSGAKKCKHCGEWLGGFRKREKGGMKSQIKEVMGKGLVRYGQMALPQLYNKYKNPGVAAVLSFLYVGLGQIYNGEIAKGMTMLIFYSTFVGLAAYAIISNEQGALIVACVGAFFTWILGIVDACKSAEYINNSR